LLSSRDAEFQTDEFDTATWDWLRERMHYLRGDYVWLVGARHPHRIMILSNRTIACRSSPRQRLRRYR
ncbi:hypothetical protein QUS81_17210, partial [Xanthomonas citri pv. citri]